jgi:hypothetical protein
LRVSSKDNAKLLEWTYTQRKLFKQCGLATQKIELLQKLEGWTWNLPKDQVDKLIAAREAIEPVPLRLASWFDHYSKLCALLASKGDLSVSLKEDDNLYHWMARQRSRFRDGQLSQEKIDLLAKLEGWTWDKKGVGGNKKEE